MGSKQHNRLTEDSFKPLSGVPEVIPFMEYATQIPKSEMKKYMSPIFVVFLARLLRNSQDQMNSYSTFILIYFQLPVRLPTGNEVKKLLK